MKRHLLCLLAVLITVGLPWANAQAVNVLWINDIRNTAGKAAIEGAVANIDTASGGGATLGVVETLEIADDAYDAAEKVCAKLGEMKDAGNSPDIILDSTLAARASEIVKSLSKTLGIPTVSMAYGDVEDSGEWKDLTAAQKKYLVQARPPGDLMPISLRTLIEEHEISNAGIIFDPTFVMDYKYRSLLMNVPTRHLINKMKMEPEEIRKQLKMLDSVDLNNIFLLAAPDKAEMYLKVANEVKMYGEKYSWFVMSKDDLNEVGCNCENMTVITLNPRSKSQDKTSTLERSYNVPAGSGSAIDLAFYFDTTVIALTAMTTLRKADTWAPLDIPKCEDFTDDNVVERNIDLYTALTASAKASNHYGMIVFNMDALNGMDFSVLLNQHMFTQGKKMKMNKVGTWDSLAAQGIQYEAGMAAKNFAAKTVYTVAVVKQAPFVMAKEDGSGYEGYCIELIDELKKLMGFEYELVEAPDGQYGRMDENEQWNGMIRMLVDKEADIALGALSVMAERENVVDFTVPYYDLVGITILMRKPTSPTSLFKFLTVLETSVWICILAAYFITSVLMWIFDRWSPYSYQNNMEKYKDDDEKRYFNLKECLWFCMTSLTPQGGGEAPKNLSGRLVAATWWLFGFIIIASYTANLAAFLTVSRLETPVESLEDLSKQYKILYSPMNGSSTMTYFERMAYIEEKFYEIWKDLSLNDSLSDLERSKLAVWDYPVSDKYTKMWQSMREAKLPMTLDEAVERVRKSESSSEGYAFLGDATDIKYLTLTNCDLQMVGEEFSRKPYALAVQQGSPLKDQFNDAILKLLNQRTLETLKERWWNQNPKKMVCDDTDDNSGGISIYNIGGVFIVIFVGIGLAIITLIIEYWYYKYKKPQSRDDSGSKKLQVKQAIAAGAFGDKKDFDTEYRNNGSNIAPVANPW